MASTMIQWMRTGGGFMNDKIEIRRRIPEDFTSPVGIFAKEDLAEKERLFHVPPHLYISVQHDEIVETAFVTEEEREDVQTEDYFKNSCTLSQHLLNETKKYRQSPASTRFEPYIRYLEETQHMGQIPATYSAQGKNLLRMIHGGGSSSDPLERLFPTLDMVDWIDNNLVRQGCFEAHDTDAYHAVALTIQRGFDLDLIPVWDFVNHDVRERVNVDTTAVREDGGLQVWTSRKILTGEEILYSYNYCEDCQNEGYGRGTTGILEDFGFVEDYPQEWPFLERNLDAKIIQEQTSDRYVAVFSNAVTAPSRDVVDFFIRHLYQLRSMGIESKLKQLECPYERSTITRYYESLLIALSSIIQRGLEMEVKISEDGDTTSE
jgi:hypothetical protein